MIAKSGIEMLGEGVNFEIEYFDLMREYREYVFVVHPDYTLVIAIVVTSEQEAILWVTKNTEFYPLYILFPHGISEFVDFRNPEGQSVLHKLIEA